MHPCCNELSGSIQHWDFLTDGVTELYSKVLNIIPLPNTLVSFLRTRGQAVPLQRYFELFVFLSHLFPYTRQFSASLNSIIVLSPDICQCSVRPNLEPATHPPAAALSPCSDGRRDCLAKTRTAARAEWWLSTLCRVQLKYDVTRWRTGGKVKGKLANGVGSQYASHYLRTWCIEHYCRWWAHLGCQ